jgi:hypothetical protein
MVYAGTVLEEDLEGGGRADFRMPGQRGFVPLHIGGFEIGASLKEAIYRVRSETPVGADNGDPLGTSSFVEQGVYDRILGSYRCNLQWGETFAADVHVRTAFEKHVDNIGALLEEFLTGWLGKNAVVRVVIKSFKIGSVFVKKATHEGLIWLHGGIM